AATLRATGPANRPRNAPKQPRGRPSRLTWRLRRSPCAAMSNEATLANWRGMESLRSGDAAAAAEHFNQACRADPAAGELWINLATACRLLGDDERERSALEQALAIDQRNLMALIRLAQLHERLAE